MTTNPQTTDPQTSFTAAIARIFWMMIGPLALILLAFKIVQTGNSWLTPIDLAFFAVLAAVIVGRWLEFRGGDPRTTTGEPATPADLRRFVVAAMVGGFGVWALANVLGVHLLT